MSSLSQGLILQRTSSFFVFSFLWAGAIYVLPQLYLLEHDPQQKSLLLSILLFLGTACAWLGVRLSQNQYQRGQSFHALHGDIALIVVMGKFVYLWFGVAVFWLYILIHLVFRVASNWLVNHMDVTFLHHAGHEGAGVHASS
ncbi:MAG: hypothetical protein EP343_25060 [Deltaproteobacteria bacterium]|nr:MAG: hypothetical protein EP343_25060 [Deltaproteobacteria bacterium]